MQVILAAQLVVDPAILPEKAAPVGGLFARFALFPDVKIGVGFNTPAAFLEPPVLVAGVVDDQIHDDADVPLFGFGDQGIHIRQRTVIGVNIAVIADIIAVIPVGRGINRRKPQSTYPKLLQIIQPGDDAGQVADPIAVGVAKAHGIDLIDHLLFPPRGLIHSDTPPLRLPGPFAR